MTQTKFGNQMHMFLGYEVELCHVPNFMHEYG